MPACKKYNVNSTHAAIPVFRPRGYTVLKTISVQIGFIGRIRRVDLRELIELSKLIIAVTIILLFSQTVPVQQQ